MTEPTDEQDEAEEGTEGAPERFWSTFPVRNSAFKVTPPIFTTRLISDVVGANFKPRLSILTPQVNVFNQHMAGLFKFEFKSPFEGLVEDLNRVVRAQWEPIFKSIHAIVRQVFPENWEDVQVPSADVVESILVDEGIPLMWVPRAQIVHAIFEANSASERRRIIGRRWKGIISDCEAVLEGVRHQSLDDACDFGNDCIRALRDGHTNPAQALAGNLLDTLLSTHLSKETRVALTKNDLRLNGVKFNLDDYKLRVAFTFAPVWCAHAKFFPKSGDPIPRAYGRHPTIHAVSRAQYTRINAVMAMMLVTSVIKFIDVELARRGSREGK